MAIHAVDEVMRFCREVLLVEILRLLYRNPQYRPDTIGGGEDWFTFYRQFWEEIADGSVSRHLVGLKLDQFRSQAASLFPTGGPSPLLSYVASPTGKRASSILRQPSFCAASVKCCLVFDSDW